MPAPLDPLSRLPAVVLAGGVAAPGDPLFALARGGPKSLIDLRGRPLIDYTLAALEAAPAIADVVVVGVPPASILPARRIAVRLPDQGSLVRNALAGLRWTREQQPDASAVLLCTADLPLLTPALVGAFLAMCSPPRHDLYYPIVSRAVMEAAFPAARRTYARLRDGEFAGGDMALIHPRLLDSDPGFWEALTGARKHPLRLAGVVGLTILLKAALGRLTVRDVETRAARRLGLSVRAVEVPHAELAMDVDKPHQLALAAERLGAAGTTGP